MIYIPTDGEARTEVRRSSRVFQRLFLLLGRTVCERFEQLEGQGEDDRGVLLGGNLRQRAQKPELEGLGVS